MVDNRSHVVEVPGEGSAGISHPPSCSPSTCPYEDLDTSDLDRGAYKVTGGSESPEFEPVEVEGASAPAPGPLEPEDRSDVYSIIEESD